MKSFRAAGPSTALGPIRHPAWRRPIIEPGNGRAWDRVRTVGAIIGGCAFSGAVLALLILR